MLDTTDVYRKAVEMLTVGDQEASLYENYSGRAMFGATVPGIVTDVCGPKVGAAITIAAISLTLENCENVYDVMGEIWVHIPVRTDNMGLSFIYY